MLNRYSAVSLKHVWGTYELTMFLYVRVYNSVNLARSTDTLPMQAQIQEGTGGPDPPTPRKITKI